MTNSITLQINQRPVAVRAGVTVMAALSLDGPGLTRYSVLGAPRSAVCGMGVCQECRVVINGASRLACQTLAAEGMVVQTATLEGSP